MSHTKKELRDLREKLIEGYREMSGINIEESEVSIESCNEALRISEEKLTECE